MTLHLFWCISYADILNTLLVIFTAALAGIAYIQSRIFIRNNRMNFTYKVDENFENFLNDPNNLIAKNWLLNNDPLDINNRQHYNQLQQLFDKAETINALENRKGIDEQMFYDLLSYSIERFFIGGKTPTANDFITEERRRAREVGITNSDDIYIGVQTLYARIILRKSKAT